ncbi:MAG: 30S ribosomal protein S3Ae [Candidatus Bathyarchaeota archaeon BA1]|nr:MAG: 30S ribosomal protein S3Ae [Candidatus Bathyarchaeota archaeon BA1]
MRLAVCAFTLTRIKTSQEQLMRIIMRKLVEEKAGNLSFDQFVQETVLGKIASDIYNEVKKIAPVRHVGIRKSKLTYQPTVAA